jgi:predicted esterase
MKPILALVVAGTLVSECREPGVRHVPTPAPVVPAPAARSASRPEIAATAGNPMPWPRAKPPKVETDWCIDAVDALDEETCFALPDKPATSVLVYFHGIVPPTRESHQKTNYETVVANASRRAGAVALMPRGKQGLAPAGHDGWWGWPTTAPQYWEHAKAIVDSVSMKTKRIEDLVGTSFSKMYVAGSSSGAYFVAALALHGDIRADGFAVISGGSGKITPELARLEPKPFYVGYGTYDSVQSSARALGELLRHAGWPVRVAEHPLGHGAHEVYLDEAFEFFSRSGRE